MALHAAASGMGAIALSWETPADPGSSPVTGYRVYRSAASGGPYQLLATLGPTTQWNDTGLPPGALRFYVVAAESAAGEGAPSAQAGAVTASVAAMTNMSAHLSGGLTYGTAAWAGPHIYIFGGEDSNNNIVDRILRYDPANDTLTEMATRLPTPVMRAASAWTGQHVYIFGGFDMVTGTGPRDQILRYDPATDSLLVLPTKLPRQLQFMSAVWTGEHVYLFGGSTPGVWSDEIVRFDPATGIAQVMGARLPTARGHAGAVWIGAHAYVFGGYDAAGQVTQIVRYDPAQDATVVMGATLPLDRYYLDMVHWDSPYAYILGGASYANGETVLRYDPVADAITPGPTLPEARRGFVVGRGQQVYFFGGATILSLDLGTGTSEFADTKMLYGRFGTGAVWTGTHAYVFGGRGYRDITRYDPASDTLTVMETKLPPWRTELSAVWTGQFVYLFGTGASWAGHEVLRYDPASDVLTSMGARLPPTGSRVNAVWTGSHAYIFGIDSGNHNYNGVARYDPATDNLTMLPARLPFWGAGAASVIWAGQYAYVFGSGGEVARWDPATETATRTAATLPEHYGATSAIWDGSSAYIFGGIYNRSSPIPGVHYSRAIVRYDAASDTASLFGELPTARAMSSAVWTGHYALIFGGMRGEVVDHVVRHGLRALPGAARSVAAAAGAGDGEIVLSWNAPASAGSSPVAHYAVYRATAPAGPFTMVAATHAAARAFSELRPVGVPQYYRLSAISAEGESPRSPVVTATAQDWTPPLIAPTLDGTAGSNGWYRSDVVVSWSVTDSASNVTATQGCETSTLAADSAGTTYTCTATSAGGTRSHSVTVKRDTTPPVIATDDITAPGWDTSGTPVSYAVPWTDALGASGSAACVPPSGSVFPTGSTALACEAVDPAGNVASASVMLHVVPSPPPAPRNLTASATAAEGEIALAWDPPARDGGAPVTRYRLYSAPAPGGPYSLLATTTGRHYVDAGVPPGTLRVYRASALTSAGEGIPTNDTLAMTAVAPPTSRADQYKMCPAKTQNGWLCTRGSDNPVVAIDAGAGHTCVLLSTGNADCWGENADRRSDDRAGRGLVAIDAGPSHTCGVRANGDVDCWGDNAWGRASGYQGGDATAVAAGGTHTCILRAIGDTACFGSNAYGQSTPYGGGDAIAVSAGQLHTCLLLRGGNVTCFGDDRYGQALQRHEGDVIAVSAGPWHTCVLIAGGDVHCEGQDHEGRTAGRRQGDAIALSSGQTHTCILLRGGNVTCFGSDRYGQASGYAGGDAVAVSAGRFHTTLLLSTGRVIALGTPPAYADFGQAEPYP